MLIRLNDGENVTVTSRRTGNNKYTIICRGDWIGLRAFKEEETEIAKKFVDEIEEYRRNYLMSHLMTSETTKMKIKDWLEFLEKKEQHLNLIFMEFKDNILRKQT